MTEVIKIAGFLALSATKFFFTPSVMVVSGYSYWEVIVISITGGWLGILFFYYFGGFLFRKILQYRDLKISEGRMKPKKVFTRKNKFIVKVKSNYGLVGLALISPVLISIPIGSLVAARYFWKNPLTIPVMFAAVAFWAFALTTISQVFRL